MTILAILGFCTPSRSVTSLGKIWPMASPSTQPNAVRSRGESMAFVRETSANAAVVGRIVRGTEPSRDDRMMVATMRSVTATITAVIVRKPIRRLPVTATALGSLVIDPRPGIIVAPC